MEPVFVVETVLDEKCLREVIWKGQTKRQRLDAVLGLFSWCVLCVAMPYYMRLPITVSIVAFVTGVLLYLCRILSAPRWTVNKLRKQYGSREVHETASFFGNVIHLRSNTSGSTLDIPYWAIADQQETKHFFVLYLRGDNKIVILSKAGFTKGVAEEFLREPLI